MQGGSWIVDISVVWVKFSVVTISSILFLWTYFVNGPSDLMEAAKKLLEAVVIVK